jgi:hypothetical protein
MNTRNSQKLNTLPVTCKYELISLCITFEKFLIAQRTNSLHLWEPIFYTWPPSKKSFPIKFYIFLSFPSTIYKLTFSNANYFTILWQLSKLRSCQNITYVHSDIPYTYTRIHSFSSLFYDRSKASSKASSPPNAIQSFLFQMRVFSPFLKVIQ